MKIFSLNYSNRLFVKVEVSKENESIPERESKEDAITTNHSERAGSWSVFLK